MMARERRRSPTAKVAMIGNKTLTTTSAIPRGVNVTRTDGAVSDVQILNERQFAVENRETGLA